MPRTRVDHVLGRGAVQRVTETVHDADVGRQGLEPLDERGLGR